MSKNRASRRLNAANEHIRELERQLELLERSRDSIMRRLKKECSQRASAEALLLELVAWMGGEVTADIGKVLQGENLFEMRYQVDREQNSIRMKRVAKGAAE